MSSSLRQEPLPAKRERILRAAVEVFARRGFFNARVSDVAKAAGVADGTIYLYFNGKEDLLITIFRELMQKYLADLRSALEGERTVVEKIRRLVRFHLESLGADRSLAVVFQVELRHSLKFMALFSQQELADYLALIRSLIEEGQKSGTVRSEIPAQLIAKVVFGAIDEAVTSWILSEKEWPLASQTDDIADFILRGIGRAG